MRQFAFYLYDAVNRKIAGVALNLFHQIAPEAGQVFADLHLRLHVVRQAHQQVIAKFPVLAGHAVVIAVALQRIQITQPVVVRYQPADGKPGVAAPAELVHQPMKLIGQMDEIGYGVRHAGAQAFLAAHAV